MAREETVEKILNWFYGDDFEKDSLRQYLLGETQEEPECLEHIRLGYYTTLEIFEEEEDNKIVYQMISVLSRVAPKVLLDNNYTQNRYDLYKKSNVSEKFIMKNFVHSISYLCSYYQPAWFEKMIDMLNGFEKNYPELADKLVKEYDKQKEEKQIGAVLLMAKKVKEKKEDSSNEPIFFNLFKKVFQETNFTEELEKIVYSIIKKLYDKKEIERVLDEYVIEEEYKNYYYNLVPVELNFNKIDDVIENNLFNIFDLCADSSPILYEAARIASILAAPEFLYKRYERNGETYVWEFIDKYELPEETKLKECTHRFYRFYSRAHVEKIFSRMNEIIAKDYEKCRRVLNLMCKTKDIYFCFLLALFLKEKKLNSEEKKYYIGQIETMIMENLINMQKKENSFTFLKAGMENFEFLKDENFSPNKEEIEGNFYSYGSYRNSILIPAMVLIDYSVICRNLVNLMIPLVNEYTLQNLTFFSYYNAVSCYEGNSVYTHLYNEIHMPLVSICYLYLCGDNNPFEETNKKEFLTFLFAHKEEAEKGIETFEFENDALISYINLLYAEDVGFNWKAIMGAFSRKSKTIANHVEKLLIPKEAEVRSYVEELLTARSKVISDTAIRLIRIWDNEKIEERLKQITTIEALIDCIKENYSKNNDKNVPYAKEIDYSTVRILNSEEKVPELLTKYYVSEYILLKDLYVIKLCKKIQEFVNPYDFRELIKKIYEMWISEGASTKYKNIVLPFALTASESQILILKKQIDTWANNSKPALAAFAVQSLCMNASKMALLLTDTISKKHKNKKVKTAALEAMNLVAGEMGITREELDDLIVPDMGFNKNRTRFYDYGERKFKVILNQDLTVSLYDETKGKEIKSLPKASVKLNDNEEMVAEAKEDLKAMKKQLKIVFDSQKPRIAKAILAGRNWSFEKWKALFIENPIMTGFATGLIWEELNDKKELIQTFRYMEDGSFNTVEEEEYDLKKGSYIAPLHPVDIDDETLQMWKQQLEDYEIIQPIEQLNIPVFHLKEEEKHLKEISDYKGKKVYGATFKSIAAKLGMNMDFDSYSECCGCFYTAEKEDITLKIRTKSFYLGDYDAVTELDTISFYQGENMIQIMLGVVPPKLLSFGKYAANLIIANEIKG